MNKQEFVVGIKKLELAYNSNFSNEKLQLWFNKLNKMDSKDYLNRIDELIETKQYMPNIAEILDKKQINTNYANYEQRQYSDIDFNKFYAIKGG